MAAKVSKLHEQFHLDAREKQKEGGGSQIFHGVAIYVNGYTGMTDLESGLVCRHDWNFPPFLKHKRVCVCQPQRTARVSEHLRWFA